MDVRVIDQKGYFSKMLQTCGERTVQDFWKIDVFIWSMQNKQRENTFLVAGGGNGKVLRCGDNNGCEELMRRPNHTNIVFI